MITDEVKEQFTRLTATMDIPDIRREPNEPNFKWFLRNAWIKNQNHRDINIVNSLIKKVI